MKSYFKNNRLTLEADNGKVLTNGIDLYVQRYDFPVGVEESWDIYEISEAEYLKKQEEINNDFDEN